MFTFCFGGGNIFVYHLVCERFSFFWWWAWPHEAGVKMGMNVFLLQGKHVHIIIYLWLSGASAALFLDPFAKKERKKHLAEGRRRGDRSHAQWDAGRCTPPDARQAGQCIVLFFSHPGAAGVSTAARNDQSQSARNDWLPLASLGIQCR